MKALNCYLDVIADADWKVKGMRVFYVHLPFRNGQFANIAVHFPLLSSKCRRRLTSRNSRAKNRIPGGSTHRVPGRKEDLSHMDAAQRAVRRRDFLAGVMTVKAAYSPAEALLSRLIRRP